MIRPLVRTALRPVLARRVEAHARRQRRLVVNELSASDTLIRFANGDALRPGYGLGASERVIEIPWLLSKRPSGRALDAGSSLNHPEFLDRLEPLVEQLHVITLAYEGVAYPERGISYTFDDLRDLPYRDGHFETVISISTLEHVGMDNTAYAGRTQGAAASNDPVEDTARAIRELVRVTRPGGRLLVTVPYGERQDLGWQRQFDLADIEFLLSTAAPSESEVTVYRYHSSGWALSGLEEAADAQYREAVGAEAVACISMSR